MMKKIYVDIFVFCYCTFTEGTYHHQFGKCARFLIFRLRAKTLSSFQIKRFKSSYLKIYTLLNSYSFKFLVNILNHRKSIQDLRGQNPCKNVGLV